MGTLAKLKTCNSDFEAQLLKGALRAEGIVCMLSNENITNIYGGINFAFGGIDIMVSDADLNAATEIMNRPDLSECANCTNEQMQNTEWCFG